MVTNIFPPLYFLAEGQNGLFNVAGSVIGLAAQTPSNPGQAGKGIGHTGRPWRPLNRAAQPSPQPCRTQAWCWAAGWAFVFEAGNRDLHVNVRQVVDVLLLTLF